MSAFVISNWKDVGAGALRGVFTLTTPEGYGFNECKYFVKDSARWIKPPDREFTKKDGSKSYSPMVTIDKDKREMFNSLALDAVDEFLATRDGQPAASGVSKAKIPSW